jgi:3D (Asp-Asp-Asp) domain-containing protein
VRALRNAFGVLILAAAAVLTATAPLGGCSAIRPPPRQKPVARTMRVTGYCKCGECCNWRRTWLGFAVIASGQQRGQSKAVGRTASGVRAQPGTIAADTNLYPFGTVMFVEGYGFGKVEDRGGTIKGEHIDLYFTSHAEAKRWGSRTLRVWVWPPAARALPAASSR